MVVLNFHKTNKQNESKNSIQSHIGKQIFYFGILNFFTVDSNLSFHLNSNVLLSSIPLFELLFPQIKRKRTNILLSIMLSSLTILFYVISSSHSTTM